MKKIIQALKKRRSFLISTHVNPDPDAIGSQLAIGHVLKKMGKRVVYVNEEKAPEGLRFLSGTSLIKSVQEVKRLKVDAAIIVDCGDKSRIGQVQDLLLEEMIIINIDHHITNDNFGDLNLVKPKASSSAEVLFELFKAMKVTLDKKIASLIYAGILTDTGSFRYESTTAKTHKIAAELIDCGINPTDIFSSLYEAIPVKDLKEFTKVVSRFDSMDNGKILYLTLYKKDLRRFSKGFDLRDLIFKHLRSIKGAEVFVIFTEVNKNLTRINLRSSKRFDVASLASQFNGGGHKRASGCKVEGNVGLAKRKVLAAIRKKI